MLHGHDSTVRQPNPVTFAQASAPHLLPYNTYYSGPPALSQSSDLITLAHFIAHGIHIIASVVYLRFCC